MVQTRRAFIATVGMGAVAFSEEGCSAEEWFQLALGLLPITLNTVTGLGAILGLPTGDAAAITAFAGDATTLLNDVKADVQAFQTSSDPTLIGKIQSLLTSLKTQSASIAGSLQVKDPTLLGKVEAFTNALVGDAVDLLSLLPTVTTAGASVRVIPSTTSPKHMRSVFQHRLDVAKAK